jgi:hypothetical protein
LHREHHARESQETTEAHRRDGLAESPELIRKGLKKLPPLVRCWRGLADEVDLKARNCVEQAIRE